MIVQNEVSWKHRDQRTWVQLQHEPLEVSSAVAFLIHPDAGGTDLFVGTTRRRTGERETVQLSYDAYAPMAVRVMAKLAADASDRWPLQRAVVLHRLGEVPVGSISVVIGVSTPHRAEAFDACRWLIDTLKREVPIWKQEHYRDGEQRWISGTGPPEEPA